MCCGSRSTEYDGRVAECSWRAVDIRNITVVITVDVANMVVLAQWTLN